MVFNDLPKRLRCNAQPSVEKPTLANLAHELQLQIFRDVDTLSVLRLRLTCSGMVPSSNTILQERLKTLYIHPRYIEKAIKICRHPVFSQEVEEIVLLGEPLWRGNDQICRPYRCFNIDLRSQPESQWQEGKFRNWPAEAFVGNGRLVEALSGLPKLHQLAFAERVRYPGLNQVSANTIRAHASKCASVVNDHMKPRLADAQIIYQLLNETRLRLDSIRLETELPFVREVLEAGNREYRNLDTYLTSLGRLTSLELSLDCGWDYNRPGSSRLYAELVHYSRKTIKHVKIVFTPNRAKKDPIAETRLAHIFYDQMLWRLQSLEIKLLDDPIDNSQMRKWRPTCQSFEMVSFLKRHSTTLSTVKFDNVIFCNVVTMATAYTEAVLGQIAAESRNLEHFSWIVSSYNGSYQVENRVEVRSVDFERLASRLGVELDGQKNTWDFGKAEMLLR